MYAAVVTVSVSLLVFQLMLLAVPVSPNPCPLKLCQNLQNTDSTCQFRLGQIAYGAGDYRAAAEHWQAVVSARREDDITAAALGNLGHLTYHGLGVPYDLDATVKILNNSVRLGGLEARRRLGTIYGDRNTSLHDPVRAYAWHRSAELFYKPLFDGEATKSVLQDAKEAMAELKQTLSRAELEGAESTAKSLFPNVKIKVATRCEGEEILIKAQAHIGEGKFKAAQKLFEDALKSQQLSNEARVTILKRLGQAYHHSGDYGKALDVALRSVEIAESVFGPDSPQLEPMVSSVGAEYENTGSYKLAEEYHLRALALGESFRHPDDPILAVLLNNVASALIGQNRPVGAEALLRRAQRIGKKHRSGSKLDLEFIQANLAMSLMLQDKLDEAELLYDGLLRALQERYPPNDSILGRIWWDLAVLKKQRGKLPEAKRLYEKAIGADLHRLELDRRKLTQEYEELREVLNEREK